MSSVLEYLLGIGGILILYVFLFTYNMIYPDLFGVILSFLIYLLFLMVLLILLDLLEVVKDFPFFDMINAVCVLISVFLGLYLFIMLVYLCFFS